MFFLLQLQSLGAATVAPGSALAGLAKTSPTFQPYEEVLTASTLGFRDLHGPPPVSITAPVLHFLTLAGYTLWLASALPRSKKRGRRRVQAASAAAAMSRTR